MPALSDLIDHISHVLGQDVRSMAPARVRDTLVQLGHRDLARALEVEILIPAEIPAPRPWREERNDVAEFTRAIVNEPSLSQKRPKAKPPTSTTTIGEPEAVDAEYAALVADLGLNSAAVDLERFKALVPHLGLHVYQRQEVQEYLHALYKVPIGDLTPTVVWGWRPLRTVDRHATAAMAQYNGKLQRGAPIYSKPIPYPVLLTVKAVRDACPSATFFVSDNMNAEKIPDPFLLVVVAGQEFVIERWDEPAFRAKA
jgi:hypothetical protein